MNPKLAQGLLVGSRASSSFGGGLVKSYETSQSIENTASISIKFATTKSTGIAARAALSVRAIWAQVAKDLR